MACFFCGRYQQTRWLCSQRKEKDGTEAAETEDTDALLDLLSCPHSPWTYDESWSPQAPALRQLAVLAPERLHAAFIYNYFTTLRIVDKDVSVMVMTVSVHPNVVFENMIQATHRLSPDQTLSLLTGFDKTTRWFVLHRNKNSKAYYYIYYYILYAITDIPLAALNPWFDVMAPKTLWQARNQHFKASSFKTVYY